MIEDNFDAEELLVLSRLDLEKGQTDRALLKLKRAISLGNGPAEVILEAARLYAQLGLRVRAAPLFRKYLDINQRDYDARFQLGMVLYEQGAVVDATALWEEVLHEQPAHPPALYFKALASFKSGKIDEAKRYLRDSVKAIPPDNLYGKRSRELLTEVESMNESSDPERLIGVRPPPLQH